jgi:nicotinate phosphoribosyltransferase
MALPDANDPGLLAPEEASLLIDQYELAMSASYFKRGMNERSVFELFVRRLPPNRDWLLVAGLGPALSMVERMRFGPAECEHLTGLGFDRAFVDYLADRRFSGDVDAMPEGTVAFADEPLVRVTGPRIEAQLLETLLLNQVNHQTAIATKAARIALAARGGEHVVDFSPRRDHGVDAAMKAARSAAIAGAAGTSNVAAAMRYGLQASGTMAHSYVLSFPDELAAFEAFMEDTPENAILLVDTYDTEAGVRNAIRAARATGVVLKGVRIDSGDLLELSRRARALLDEAGFRNTGIIVSGDLEEGRIEELVAAGAPIDTFGVGTDLGTSRDSPVVPGVYKLVAHEGPGGWAGVAKRSPDKASTPWPKQVFREYADGRMRRDRIVRDGGEAPGRPLLVSAMRDGEVVLRDSLEEMRERAAGELAALPEDPAAYEVERSEALTRASE